MKELELKAGRTYRSKKPCGAGPGLANDRTIIWLGANELQYDGPGVRLAKLYPKISIAAFRDWAVRDVTDSLPPGEYARWPLPRKLVIQGANGAAKRWADEQGLSQREYVTIRGVTELRGLERNQTVYLVGPWQQRADWPRLWEEIQARGHRAVAETPRNRSKNDDQSS